MRILYLDCGMGAAGDMLTAALWELLEEPQRAAFLETMNTLGLPGVKVTAEPSQKCGITGTHMSVTVGGQEEHSHDHPHDHDHTHEHIHDHTHDHSHPRDHGHDHSHDHTHGDSHHTHGSLRDIRHMLGRLDLPDGVRQQVEAVYRAIAGAESRVHGVPVEQIHFHEVGTWDAVADVTAVCLLVHLLQPRAIYASPVHVGCGTVRCAHGLLPVPAPATALLLEGVPVYGGRIEGELCTPTGAALLKQLVTRFGEMPTMRTEKIGYGMGKKDFPKANCVRAFLGTTEETGTDSVVELQCNLDDMTGEDLGFALERLLELGALDVFTQPMGMKKSRPATMLTVLCREQDRETMIEALFAHTTTLGIRETLCRRYTLDRSVETVDTPWGPVRFKTARGYGVCRRKPEYEDMARIARARGVGVEQVRREIMER